MSRENNKSVKDIKKKRDTVEDLIIARKRPVLGKYRSRRDSGRTEGRVVEFFPFFSGFHPLFYVVFRLVSPTHHSHKVRNLANGVCMQSKQTGSSPLFRPVICSAAFHFILTPGNAQSN